MSRKLKNIILFGIFIAILFFSTLTKQFSNDILWKQDKNSAKEFQGILFQNPSDIKNLRVSRVPFENSAYNLVRYNVEFSYTGDGSSFRILGTPVRQVFFDEGIEATHSVVNLKGDYDKIVTKLFNEKMVLGLPIKVEDLNLEPKSEIKVTLNPEVETYAFSIYYNSMDIKYRQEDVISKLSVFLTNANIDKFTNSQSATDAQNINFSDSGFNVNAQQIKDNSKITSISLINNVSKVLFIGAAIIILALIWVDKKNLSLLYIPLMMSMILTFYRFMDMGATAIGALIIMPIIAYISTCIARLMSKDSARITGKELKQNLAFAILFFIVVLIVIIIPRAL